MNRLVLIGNGFDLAHKLKTSYADFINWYWDYRVNGFYDEHTNVSDDGLCSFTDNRKQAWSINAGMGLNIQRYTSAKSVIEQIKTYQFYRIYYYPFFDSICKSIETKGWVDIENEYYRLLTKYSIVKPSDEELKRLNGQLQYLQKLLIQYLKEVEKQPIHSIQSVKDAISSPICYKDVAVAKETTLHDFVIEWMALDKRNALTHKWEIYGLNIEECLPEIESFVTDKRLYKYIPLSDFPKSLFLPNNVMLLNFNYTHTDKMYMFPSCQENHIHGELGNSNDIIFGYGDELDENYKPLQNLNNNECLQNVKSIRYLEAPNYRNVLSFIESAPFQVLIMGHSCGNSDRTLLNTIFEHKNCVSIKPYYYVKEDGTDNYIELVQNISRNFTDMKLMRDRVVNKTQCEPLVRE